MRKDLPTANRQPPTVAIPHSDKQEGGRYMVNTFRMFAFYPKPGAGHFDLFCRRRALDE